MSRDTVNVGIGKVQRVGDASYMLLPSPYVPQRITQNSHRFSDRTVGREWNGMNTSGASPNADWSVCWMAEISPSLLVGSMGPVQAEVGVGFSEGCVVHNFLNPSCWGVRAPTQYKGRTHSTGSLKGAI